MTKTDARVDSINCSHLWSCLFEILVQILADSLHGHVTCGHLHGRSNPTFVGTHFPSWLPKNIIPPEKDKNYSKVLGRTIKKLRCPCRSATRVFPR